MTFNQKLLAGAIICFITSILINCILINYDEIFSFGYEFGNIVDNLCLAYVSSYVFYIIVVLGKERVDKKNSIKTIAEYSRRVTWMGRTLETCLYNMLSINHVRYENSSFDKNSIIAALPNIDFRKPSSTIINNIRQTESQEMHKWLKSLMESIGEINTYVHLLDTDYIKLIRDIKENYFVRTIVPHLPIGSPADMLPGVSTDFVLHYLLFDKIDTYFDFMALIVELEKYHKKVMKKYLPDFNEY